MSADQPAAAIALGASVRLTPLVWLALLETEGALAGAYAAVVRGEPIRLDLAFTRGSTTWAHLPAPGALGWHMVQAVPYLNPGAFAASAGVLAVFCAWWCLRRPPAGADQPAQRLRTRLILLGAGFAFVALALRAHPIPVFGLSPGFSLPLLQRLGTCATLGTVLLHDALGGLATRRVSLGRLALAHAVVLVLANGGWFAIGLRLPSPGPPAVRAILLQIAGIVGGLLGPLVLAATFEPRAPRAWLRRWPRPLAALAAGLLGSSALLLANRALPSRTLVGGGFTWVFPDAVVIQFGLIWLLIRLSAGVIHVLIEAGVSAPCADDEAPDPAPTRGERPAR